MKTFSQLIAIADEVVKATQRRLPDQIRPLADSVPVVFEDWPSDEEEDDLLGLFIGPSHAEEAGDMPTPRHIVLFLESIYDFVEADDGAFRDEVRTTYLHELGHYLNWDEDQLAARGLD